MRLLRAAGMAAGLSALLGMAAAPAATAAPAPLVVTSTADGADSAPGDGTCAVAGGGCTLRAAIEELNATEARGIRFAIPGSGVRTIELTSVLPAIARPTTIDGLSQPGAAPGEVRVFVQGPARSARVVGDGLVLDAAADGSVVRGLALRQFRGAALRVRADGVRVTGSLIGLRPAGVAGPGGLDYTNEGIHLEGVTGTVIGGDTAAERNVISANLLEGGVVDAGGRGTRITGNFIGTGLDGRRSSEGFANADGVSLVGARDARVERNVLAGNSGSGVRIDRGGGHVVAGNDIGIDATGERSLGNATGVFVIDSPGNLIGGTTAEARNVIAAGGLGGVIVRGHASDGTRILGNHIGTDRSGVRARVHDDDLFGNFGPGIDVHDAPGTIIGAPGAGNVIVMNGRSQHAAGVGLKIAGAAAEGTVLQANLIGVGADGRTPLGNGAGNVLVDGAPGTLIGGSAPGEGNVISDSGFGLTRIYGIWPAGDGLRIAGAAARGTRILGNRIGTDATGTRERANSDDAIAVFDAPDTTIGGTGPGEGNVVAGQRIEGRTGGEFGISVHGGDLGRTEVLGNHVGTDVTGTEAMGFGACGIILTVASGVHVSDNVVVDNGSNGIQLGAQGAPVGPVVAEGNRVGVDAAGKRALGNLGTGIAVVDAARLELRGNVVSGGRGHGIDLMKAAAGALLTGNRVGTNAAGTATVPNRKTGVVVRTGDVVLGGAAPGAGNTISGNEAEGIAVLASRTRLAGNRIGTSADGTQALPNGNVGVLLFDDGDGARVGGVAPGEGNVIAHNARGGVLVLPGSSGNALRANRLFANGGLGIDLVTARADGSHVFGVTPNDPRDADTGANGLQNAPELLTAKAGKAGADVVGTLRSTPRTTFDVDVYTSPATDAGAGAAQARRHVGTVRVTTSAGGVAPVRLRVPAAKGELVTSTATAPDGSTSELGKALVVK